MNVAGASAKPRFVYESFARRRSRPASAIASWSNAMGGRVVDGMPGGVLGHCGVEVGRHEPEIRRGEFPLGSGCGGIAQRLQLLEVGELADVDLHGEVAADGLLERLSRLEVAAGEGPRAGEWLHGALPDERLEDARANLEDDGER